MITRAIAYRNGEYVKEISLLNCKKTGKDKSEILRLFILEVERAAYANPENKYWVDLKNFKKY